MANQFHRLQTQAELHRPERTGRGNPNDLTEFSSTSSYTIDPSISVSNSDLIFNPEDGQYYQDLNTGDVYRFVKFDDYTSEDSFVGDVSITKGDPESGQKTSILVTNTSVSSENSLSLTDLQKLKLISSDGGVQILTVDQDQTFTSSSFSIKVLPFTYEFNIGSFYGITAEVRQATTGAYWEKLIEYDRDSQKITNVVLKADSDAIGEVTVAFGGEEVVQSETGGGVFFRYNGENYSSREDAEKEALSDGLTENEAEKAWRRIVVEPETVFKRIPRDVQTVTANLFAQVTEGEEITIFNPETAESIKLTINDDGNDEITAFGPGENVVLDVQDDKTNKRFPVGSLIFAEEGFRESSIKVDPSRIQLSVIGERKGDGIGTLSTTVGVGTTSQLSLKDIDETVNIKDNQSLILVNKLGDVKRVVANGAQTLTSGTDTLNIDSITITSGEPIFEADTSIIREPSYASSSRITVQDGEITQAVSTSNQALQATASIQTQVNDLESSITNTVTWNDSTGFTRLSAGPEGSSFVVKADQISINGTTTFGGGYDPSTKETPGGAQSKATAARNQARDNVATNLGYSNYSDMVSEAQAGKTIISGGFIRTSLIQANAVLANQILAQDANITGDLTLGSSDGAIKASRVRLDSTRGLRFNSDYSFESEPASSPDKFTTLSFGTLTGTADLYLSYDQTDDTLYFIDDQGHISGTLVVDKLRYQDSIGQFSDKTTKENIVPLGETLDKICQLDAQVYDMENDDQREIGLFAQDVEPLFPEAVGEAKYKDSDGSVRNVKTLSYIQLIPALIESVKELKQQNEELKTRIEGLEQQS